MTDTTEDLELFDDAKEEFASKDDLRNRLVLVWVTGKMGTRKSEASGKTYEWVEATTLVVDDGDNWTGKVMDSNSQAERDALVLSVAENGPQLVELQYSFGGMVARLKQRIGPDGKPKNYKPMLGRINSRPNKTKGMAPSWSVAEPTPEDRATAMKYADRIREVSTQVKAAVEGSPTSDEEAFE